MITVITDMFKSKKFIAAASGAIAAAAMRIGLELPPADIAAILCPVVAYILGQGWADHGKEAVKIRAT